MFTLKYTKSREWDSEDDETPGLWHREGEQVERTTTFHQDEEEEAILESCIPDDPDNPIHIEIIRWPAYYDVLQFFYPRIMVDIYCYNCGAKTFEAVANPQIKGGFLQCSECGTLVPGIDLKMR